MNLRKCLERVSIRFVWCALIIGAVAVCFPTASAGAPPPDEPAVVMGKVTDSAGKPVPNALVAAYDAHRNVVSSARADAHGVFSMGVPRTLLHLDVSGKTFFTQVRSNFNRAVTVASTMIPVAHLVTEGATQVKNARQGSSGAQPEIVIDSALLLSAAKGRTLKPTEAQKLPGALMVKAVATDCQDLTAVTQTFWLQQESPDAGPQPHSTVVGWLDPLVLNRSASGKISTVSPVPVELKSARIVPSLARPGDTVKISVQLKYPDNPRIMAVVIARDSETGSVWELKRTARGVYAADAPIDPHWRANDHVITILAYPSDGSDGGRRSDLEEEINRAGLWNPRKQYIFNPALLVSRNRCDLTLTVTP